MPNQIQGERMNKKIINRKLKEQDIQKGIMSYLELQGFLVVKFPSVGIKKPDGSYIPMRQKGIADILFWGRGIAGAIEVKKHGNKVTPEQSEFLEKMRDKGYIGMVAYSIDDVMEIISLYCK